MCHSLFIHSSIKGHLDFFQVLVIMNKAAINIWCRFLYGYKFSAPLGKIPRSTIARLYIKSMFIFVRNCLSSKVAESFCILTSSEWEFLLLCSLSAVGGGGVMDFGHSKQCVVVSCICIFFDTWYGAYLQMLTCHLYIFFGVVSIKGFGLFFNWVVFLF